MSNSTSSLITQEEQSAKHRKQDKKPCILVLWAEQFDAVAVTSLIAEVRSAGIATYIVGLRCQRVAGEYGLAIYPDMLLDEALSIADRVSHIVIPCGAAGFQKLEIEPRVSRLLQQTVQNQARLILPHANVFDLEKVGVPIDEPRQIITYTDKQELMQSICYPNVRLQTHS
ncbi:MAG: DJ-1/PfpI family protein [Chloroflexota bacterium]